MPQNVLSITAITFIQEMDGIWSEVPSLVIMAASWKMDVVPRELSSKEPMECVHYILPLLNSEPRCPKGESPWRLTKKHNLASRLQFLDHSSCIIPEDFNGVIAFFTVSIVPTYADEDNISRTIQEILMLMAEITREFGTPTCLPSIAMYLQIWVVPL